MNWIMKGKPTKKDYEKYRIYTSMVREGHNPTQKEINLLGITHDDMRRIVNECIKFQKGFSGGSGGHNIT